MLHKVILIYLNQFTPCHWYLDEGDLKVIEIDKKLKLIYQKLYQGLTIVRIMIIFLLKKWKPKNVYFITRFQLLSIEKIISCITRFYGLTFKAKASGFTQNLKNIFIHRTIVLNFKNKFACHSFVFLSVFEMKSKTKWVIKTD